MKFDSTLPKHTVWREIFIPVLILSISLSLSMGEFKNGQISVSSIILSNVLGRIQDGVEVFESAEWRKLRGRN